MTVEKIVKEWLKVNGYAGLCNPDAECGCELSDLNCCCGSCFGCEPAYKHLTPEDHDGDFLMSNSKTPPEATE